MLTVFVLVLLVKASTSLIQEEGGVRHRMRHEARSNDSSTFGSSSRRPCDLDHLEYRLTRLEVQVAEKSESLRSEMREGGRRLQALEWQSADVQTALEGFRNELGRLTETNRPHPTGPSNLDKLELRIENLAKGIQLVVAALRGINSDIAAIKRNVSAVARDTRYLLLNHDELVTKPFLHNSLAEVKQHHHPPPSRLADSRIIDEDLPRNCKEVQDRGNNISGIYRIQPELAPRAFMVLCDMDSRGGGWTYIHNRYDGVQDFYLNWHNYKVGFGNLGGEFWLGLEYLHQLTGYEVNELLIELVDVNLKKAYSHYAAFSVGSELEGYALKVLGGYEGNAEDSLMYHAGSKFSTKDMDQDSWPEGNCAQAHTGAWWYKSCDMSNLNGRYLKGDLPEDLLYQGMYWGGFHGARYSLLRARMLVRPRDETSRSIFT